MKKLTSTLAFVLATSIYLLAATGICFMVYRLSNLDESLGIDLGFGQWLGITIIIKTLFIDSQLFFANKTIKDDK